ncbi:siderophore ABC transporter substrate-binding protein [Fulvimarina sp. 2208YS6-2-32]
MTAAMALPTHAQDKDATVSIATDQGERTVPQSPETVVVYDLATIDTLDGLGVAIDGVPAAPYPAHLADYAEDGTAKVGTLFEPDFEAVNALAPDLVITGGRSRSQTEALSDIATTIDMSVDPANYLESAMDRIRALGTIFGKADAANEAIETLQASITALNEEAEGAGKGLIVLTTGNRISAFGPGSRFGVLHTGFGIEAADPGLDTGNHGEAVSHEYIAKTDPDWLFVIDRDAAIGRGSAAALLDNELVRGTKAWTNGRVVYLDAANWYLAGSGLQSMQKSVDQIREALRKGSS